MLTPLTPFMGFFLGSVVAFIAAGLWAIRRQDKYGTAGIGVMALLWCLYVICMSLLVIVLSIKF